MKKEDFNAIKNDMAKDLESGRSVQIPATLDFLFNEGETTSNNNKAKIVGLTQSVIPRTSESKHAGKSINLVNLDFANGSGSILIGDLATLNKLELGNDVFVDVTKTQEDGTAYPKFTSRIKFEQTQTEQAVAQEVKEATEA